METWIWTGTGTSPLFYKWQVHALHVTVTKGHVSMSSGYRENLPYARVPAKDLLGSKISMFFKCTVWVSVFAYLSVTTIGDLLVYIEQVRAHLPKQNDRTCLARLFESMLWHTEDTLGGAVTDLDEQLVVLQKLQSRCAGLIPPAQRKRRRNGTKLPKGINKPKQTKHATKQKICKYTRNESTADVQRSIATLCGEGWLIPRETTEIANEDIYELVLQKSAVNLAFELDANRKDNAKGGYDEHWLEGWFYVHWAENHGGKQSRGIYAKRKFEHAGVILGIYDGVRVTPEEYAKLTVAELRYTVYHDDTLIVNGKDIIERNFTALINSPNDDQVANCAFACRIHPFTLTSYIVVVSIGPINEGDQLLAEYRTD